MNRTWRAGAIAISFFLLTAASASAIQRDDQPVRTVQRSPGLSLSSTEQNVVNLTADPGDGDVSLTGINSTLTVTCGGACSGVSGQGSDSLVVPASNFTSTVRVDVTPAGSGKAGVRAQQGGSTAQVSMSSSSSSSGGSSSVTTTSSQSSSSSGGTTTVVTSGGSTVSSGSVRNASFAIFVFAGGDYDTLTRATSCPSRAAAFWAIVAGEFLTYVPGAQVSVVNAEFLSVFPSGIPAQTPLISLCLT
jgi:hypothetical protein